MVDVPFVAAPWPTKPLAPFISKGPWPAGTGFTLAGSALAVFASSRDVLLAARNGFSPADKTRYPLRLPTWLRVGTCLTARLSQIAIPKLAQRNRK